MYHTANKNSSFVRAALYKEYHGACQYCGISIQPRHMHVDHILPTNIPQFKDDELVDYLEELERDGFISDSLENYLPACPSCNIKKGNRLYKASNLRFFHEQARNHIDNLLRIIEQEKKNKEFFYEPVDVSIWEPVNYEYQRGLSHAIMGYRLSSADVASCPTLPQVEKTEKQIGIVDYAIIQGETGCGKSISLFQVGYSFWKKNWQVYLLKNSGELSSIVLPDNTEDSLYIIDDAQIYPDYLIESICRQARPNRKVLLAKTVSDFTNSDTIVILNSDSVNVLYREYLRRKNEVLPIVNECDRTVGANKFDISIEQRLEAARKATTPWQFSYILRGGWHSMKEWYSSICNHNNNDLLAAAIAAFQILKLDEKVHLDYINMLLCRYNPAFNWTKEDLAFLINKKIVLSIDDIRIVHLQSACIIVSLFFDCRKTEKQAALLCAIEKEFKEKSISPLGIVWLCNGCGRDLRYYYDAEALFLTDCIINSVEEQIKSLNTSEEVRNMMYLLEKIIISDKEKRQGIQIVNNNLNILLELIKNVNSVSAWAFKDLINSLYNYDKRLYSTFSRKIDWINLINRMMSENSPSFYAWGSLLNRGLSLQGHQKYLKYSDTILSAMKWAVSKATTSNISEITDFFCSVAFLNIDQIHDLMPQLLPVYRRYFERDLDEAIDIFDFEFLYYICGVNLLEENNQPSEQQRKTAKMIIDAIPNDQLATVISNSNLQRWFSIENVLLLLSTYDYQKYKTIMQQVDLKGLSARVKNSWSHCHEIEIIFMFLLEADNSIAKEFLKMNLEYIKRFFAIMIVVDTKCAIKMYQEKKISLELLNERRWRYSFEALKALVKTDSSFTREFIKTNSIHVVDEFNKVCALDFLERYALDFLRKIRDVDNETFIIIASKIDKDTISKNWDNCGYNPRKKRWVEKRKKEFFDLIN